jgi:hypothetical protein
VCDFLQLNSQDPASTPYVTRIYAYDYPSQSAPTTFVFEQYFPVQVNTGADSSASDTDVVSSWPSFVPQALGPPLNYLTYYDTFAYAHIGHWKNPAFPGGNEGGAPLVWFDQELNSLILSPLTYVACWLGLRAAQLLPSVDHPPSPNAR